MGRAREPHTIGRYEIRRELGRGVMGVVYEAWDPALGRRIALKTITPVAASKKERLAWEQRFLTEARAAARLSHPAIVVVHDVGRDEQSEILYIALEYLEGETLAEKIATGGPLPWRTALGIVARVAEALHHAHAQGVIHRDVKPANIMLLPSGAPKILDFGVARLDGGALTHPGDLCGTPLYMSPEQAAGQVLDARSDIFSLGAVAWALLTGRSPFEAMSLPAVLARVMHRMAPPLSEVVHDVPSEVDAIVARAMAKQPEERYDDGRALVEDIEDVLAARPPRHRGEWQPPAAADRTVASTGPHGLLLSPELPGGAAGAHPQPRQHRPRAWIRLALMLALAGSAAAYLRLHPEDGELWLALSRDAAVRVGAILLRHGNPPSAAGAGRRSVPALTTPAPSAAVPVAPSTGGPTSATADVVQPTLGPFGGSEGSLAQVPGHAAEPASTDEDAATEKPERGPLMNDVDTSPASEPSDEPLHPAAALTPAPAADASGATRQDQASEPVRSPTAAPATTSPRPVRSPKPASAFLSLGFEHRLKSGSLQVWIDGAPVASETLDSRRQKKVLLFEVRKGSVQETLRVSPGSHEVKVRVRSNGETKLARTTARFRAGLTRRLELKISWLSGRLSLEWK